MSEMREEEGMSRRRRAERKREMADQEVSHQETFAAQRAALENSRETARVQIENENAEVQATESNGDSSKGQDLSGRAQRNRRTGRAGSRMVIQEPEVMEMPAPETDRKPAQEAQVKPRRAVREAPGKKESQEAPKERESIAGLFKDHKAENSRKKAEADTKKAAQPAQEGKNHLSGEIPAQPSGQFSALSKGYRPSGQIPVQPSGQVPQVSRGYRPSGQVPVQPSGQMPQVNMGYRPSGQVPVQPSGQMPQVNMGYRPSGQVPVQPSGQMPQVNMGYRPSGQVPVQPSGQMPQVNMGYRPSGQVPVQPSGQMTQVNMGYRPSGQMPQVNMGYTPSGQVPVQPSSQMPQVNTGYRPSGQVPVQPSGQVPQVNMGYAPSGSRSVQRGTQTSAYTEPQGTLPPESRPVKEQEKIPFPVKYAKQIRTGAIAVAALVLVIFVGSLVMRQMRIQEAARQLSEYVEPYDALYVPGVYVDGIALEGMSRVQAKAMVESNAQQRSNAWSVTLTYNGQNVRTITASDLSMSVEVDVVLDEAWAKGHTGTLEERRTEMQQLLENPYRGYTANPSGDTSVIDDILKSLESEVYRAPRDASIASFDPSLTYPFTFQEEVIGRSLDTASLKEEIYHRLSEMESGEIELNIITTQPSVTVETIKEEKVALRGSGTTPIAHSSAEERNQNIRTAFSKISGTIVQPGATFSFNGTVGPRTEKNGFLPAIEYAYGELSDGIGGGVCQASTTVYLAAVRSGMEILKREPHSDAVSYIEYGKDATVYWYSNHKIDLSFKNTTDSPIYITASVQSSPLKRTNLVCVVNIYGAGMDGISYDIVTQETVIEAPTEPEYVKDKKGEYVTYTDQQKIVRKASPGCSVDSWRVTYRDGKEVDRTFMYTDVYNPKAERIYVGVTPR